MQVEEEEVPVDDMDVDDGETVDPDVALADDPDDQQQVLEPEQTPLHEAPPVGGEEAQQGTQPVAADVPLPPVDDDELKNRLKGLFESPEEEEEEERRFVIGPSHAQMWVNQMI